MAVSAVVLTHNDAPVIARCLSSLQWCDEVIVVDDASTDETRAIARAYGAKVFIHALGDDFAAQRNAGLEKAAGEWVLFVDSDEVVSRQLAEEIQSLLSAHGAQRHDGCRGFVMPRNDYWGGRWLRHGETATVRLLRLARKGSGRWEQPVHEVWAIEGKVGTLVHPILHYPHPEVAQFLDEINRYSTIRARFLYAQGVKEPTWHVVAKPLAKFFTTYLLRLGFLDGTAGIIVAIMMSFHSFLVRGKLVNLWRGCSSFSG